MTPDQQATLESIAGRALTEAEIALAEDRVDNRLAESLSVGRVRIAPKEIGIGTMLAALAPNGGAFMDGLIALGETDRNVYWAVDLIKQGKLDVGMAATREQVLALAAEHPELASAATSLLALAEVPDVIPAARVSEVLNG